MTESPDSSRTVLRTRDKKSARLDELEAIGADFWAVAGIATRSRRASIGQRKEVKDLEMDEMNTK
jgi:hypothetical protein